MSGKLALVLMIAASISLGGSSASAQSEEEAKSPNLDSEMTEMAELLPGFGGMFYDEKGRPTVYLTDSSSELRLKSVIPDVVIRQGDYDFRTLQRYRVELRSALSFDGVVALDVDERSNRVRISISQDLNPKERFQLRRRLVRMSADPNAVIIDETPVLLPHQTVRDTVRPIVGGLEIGFPGFRCTMGFIDNHGDTFLTNSHCTSVRGRVFPGTPYTQNASGPDIGFEVVDPPYTTGPPCPANRRCRLSDSALVAFNANASVRPRRIARTKTCNTGTPSDREIDGSLLMTDTDTALVGQVVTKVGRTTGCRSGIVTQTCVDVGVAGTDIVFFCQTRVETDGPQITQPGDSGSPVFIPSGNNFTAVGLLWGGSGDGRNMVFSPFSQVINEIF